MEKYTCRNHYNQIFDWLLQARITFRDPHDLDYMVIGFVDAKYC